MALKSRPPDGREPAAQPSDPPRSAPPPARIVERSQTFVVGVFDDILLVRLCEGADQDPRHITVPSEILAREVARRGGPMRILVFVAGTLRPPSAAVREASSKAFPSGAHRVAKIAAVVLASGFEAAVQRAVVSGFLMLTPGVRSMKVTSSLTEALPHLLRPDEAPERLVQFCERELMG